MLRTRTSASARLRTRTSARLRTITTASARLRPSAYGRAEPGLQSIGGAWLGGLLGGLLGALADAGYVAIEEDLLEGDFKPILAGGFGFNEVQRRSGAEEERLLRLARGIAEIERDGDNGVEVKRGGKARGQVGAAWDFGGRGVSAGSGGEIGADEVDGGDSEGITADRGGVGLLCGVGADAVAGDAEGQQGGLPGGGLLGLEAGDSEREMDVGGGIVNALKDRRGEDDGEDGGGIEGIELIAGIVLVRGGPVIVGSVDGELEAFDEEVGLAIDAGDGKGEGDLDQATFDAEAAGGRGAGQQRVRQGGELCAGGAERIRTMDEGGGGDEQQQRDDEERGEREDDAGDVGFAGGVLVDEDERTAAE